MDKAEALKNLPLESETKNWLYRDFILTVYLLLFDTQKEQRSVSYKNIFDLLMRQREKTKQELKSAWLHRRAPAVGSVEDSGFLNAGARGIEGADPGGGDAGRRFETIYTQVQQDARALFDREIRSDLKMVRDKVLTHHEIKTEGKTRRVYGLTDFPTITFESLLALLEESGKYIENIAELCKIGT